MAGMMGDYLLTEAEASISFSSFGLVADALLINATFKLDPAGVQIGMTLLFLGTLGFVLSVPIYAPAVGEAGRLDDVKGNRDDGDPVDEEFVSSRMEVGNVLSMYWGFFPTTLSIPLLLTATGMGFVATVTLVAVLVGFFGYTVSRYSLLHRYFDQRAVLGITGTLFVVYLLLFVASASPTPGDLPVKLVLFVALVAVLLGCSVGSLLGPESPPPAEPMYRFVRRRLDAWRAAMGRRLGELLPSR